MKNGFAVSSGVALGKARVIPRKNENIADGFVSDVDKEVHKFDEALTFAKSKLSFDMSNADGIEKDILDAHEMMLLDPDLELKIKNKISEEKKSPSKSVDEVLDEYADTFSQMEDDYLRARASDCLDIKNRLLRALNKDQGEVWMDSLENNTILISDDIYPSEMISVDKSKIAGFITEQGSETSHISILSRSLGIPAIVSADGVTSKVKDGDYIIIDGNKGVYFISPEESVVSEYEHLKAEEDANKNELRNWMGRKTVTKSGRKVKLYANIGSVEDAEAAFENDAEGIGLFRTEFLFMNRSSMPDEDEQYEAYRKVADIFKDKEVIIRTLDVGGDKDIKYLNMKKELNPFLGERAIRFCLKNQEIFKTQLRAVIRANVHGNLKIMFPMISTVEELIRAGKILNDAADEVYEKDKNVNRHIKTGIMVETPASVMIADDLAENSDFFSIGTNDLIQYTMACDRTNPNVASLYDPMHKSVQKMIQYVIEAGHRHGIPVGLCGESGADPEMILRLLDYKIDEISMTPSFILASRASIGGMY